jgi:hypothetical protein
MIRIIITIMMTPIAIIVAIIVAIIIAIILSAVIARVIFLIFSACSYKQHGATQLFLDKMKSTFGLIDSGGGGGNGGMMHVRVFDSEIQLQKGFPGLVEGKCDVLLSQTGQVLLLMLIVMS